MTRRTAIPTLLAIPLHAAQARTVAVVLDMSTGRVAESRGDDAARLLAAPGSTLKPLLLATLLDLGKLKANETVACSGRLTAAGRSFACGHPRIATPIDLPTAIAYSCNEYVAHVVRRLTPAEQANALRLFGLGRVLTSSADQALLQALGEERVEVTVLELAAGYRKLATSVPVAVRKGLEDAVEFGTAQRAAIPGLKVAGKTGSSGNGRWAWFAGFAPSVKPRFVVAVLTQGSSGGADAAPIAAELLQSALKRPA